MFRSEAELKRYLGEPESIYTVERGLRIWRWKCSCLALQGADYGYRTHQHLQWSPCLTHRAATWYDGA